MTDQELEALFQEIAQRTERVYASDPAFKGRHVKPLPPASDEHIGLMAKGIPAPIPPSYARFLRLHDGCVDFWEAWTLLGTKGRPRKAIAERVKEAVQSQGPEVLLAASSSTLTPDAIAAFERQGSAFYVPAYAVFGAGTAGRSLLFNHNKKGANGEPEVIDYDLEAKVRARHESFGAFLQATREALLRRAG